MIEHDRQLEAQLGFNLMAGGRRFGEMKLTPMPSGAYIEMPGSIVTVDQARMISCVLKSAVPGCGMVLIDANGERIDGVEPGGKKVMVTKKAKR